MERERRLGVSSWDANDFGAMHVRVAADPPLAFTGRLSGPANTTDFRLYLPELLEQYEARGGAVVIRSCEPAALEALGRRHDLVVVAAGRDFRGVFPADPARSPHRAPARHLTAGLFHGLAWPEPVGIEFTLVPGGGEVLQLPFHSLAGSVSAVAVNAVPGGPLSGLAQLDPAGDPAGFRAALLGLLQMHVPSIHERIDRSAFELTGPLDLIQGQILPVVRQAWAALSDGKYALAIGDAWVVNDPVAAQGANLGSRTACLLGDMIAAGGPYDERFCRQVEDRLWQVAAAPTLLSNALLEPPSPPVVDVLVRATQDPSVADRFVSGFGDPEGMLAMLAPERAAC
ncbi:MAG: monooxygenase [Actinomycetota bacterium]|nr:monooxygenase [Actinomycetota bacterium]